MHPMIPTIYLFLMALVLALIEIEIEGKYGWAQKLPTWYDNTSRAGKLYAMMMAGKPLTGYHLWLQIFCVMIVMLPYAYGYAFTLAHVCMTLAMFFVWASVWDFLWFVMNPNYGVYRYKQTTVWWFAKSRWVFGLFPMDYLNAVVISYGLASVASYSVGTTQHLVEHSMMVLTWLGLTALMAFLSPVYHAWRTKMNAKDDRDNLDIFHN